LYQFQTEKNEYKALLNRKKISKIVFDESISKDYIENMKKITINDGNDTKIDGDINKNDDNSIKNCQINTKNSNYNSHMKCLNDLRVGTVLVDSIKITDLLGS
jgi:hypothetical protein